jgi:hypothetical protein
VIPLDFPLLINCCFRKTARTPVFLKQWAPAGEFSPALLFTIQGRGNKAICLFLGGITLKKLPLDIFV